MNTTQIANTIADQIGPGALAMLGARDLVGFENGLQFGIRGSKKVTKIVITLEPSDTYAVAFYAGRGLRIREVASVPMVYADRLNAVITEKTGLYTSL